MTFLEESGEASSQKRLDYESYRQQKAKTLKNKQMAEMSRLAQSYPAACIHTASAD